MGRTLATRTVLIDGDTLVYEAASSHEFETQWDWDLWTLHAHLEPAITQLDAALTEIADKLKASRVIVALSDDARWRPGVLDTYKAKRSKTRKPITYRALREYLHETREVFQISTLEGDDVLGILATHPSLVEGDKVIVSIDKDLLTIPALNVNYKRAREKDDWIPLAVSEAQADYNHLMQTLTGDVTDNYAGCPGVGPVGASKLLQPHWAGRNFDVVAAWKTVVAAFVKAGVGRHAALQNARVARICRYGDYNYQKTEVILWEPPDQSSIRSSAGEERATSPSASTSTAAATRAVRKRPAK